MLALGIRYLCGVVRATHPSNRERAEWPPHPDRVFMAMASAYFETDGSPTERAALEWFERQEPPRIHAGGCQYREIVTSYVPVNDTVAPRLNPKKPYSDAQVKSGMGLLPEHRNRQPRFFPTAIPDTAGPDVDPMVHLSWPDADPSSEIRSALVALCAKVTCVGHSSSLVQMSVEDAPPDDRLNKWLPDERPNGQRLRISGSGRLSYLESQFNLADIEEYQQLSVEIGTAKGKAAKELKARLKKRFGESPPRSMRPTPSLYQGYTCAEPEDVSDDISRSVFDHHLIVLRRVGGRRFGLESTLQITEALRNTVMGKCRRQPPPEWISGHKPDGSRSEKPHLAFVPLAFVDREHADGHLLGAAIVVPRGIDSSEMRQLGKVIGYDKNGELLRTTLTFGKSGEWELQVQVEDRDVVPVTLQEAKWTANYPKKPKKQKPQCWATVTPIVFDAHPKDRWSRQDSPRVQAERQASYWCQVEDMIASAVERIGLPRPTDVVAKATSPFIGTPHARSFPMMTRKGGGNLHHTHAIITFEEPVLGPVLLGAGRYRGYGFCRPLSKGDES